MKMKIGHGRVCTLFVIFSLAACWQVNANLFWRIQRTYGAEHIRTLPFGVTCGDVIGAIKEKGNCLCAGDSIFHVEKDGIQAICMQKEEICMDGDANFLRPCYLGYGILGYRNFSDNVPRKVLRFVAEGALLDCEGQGTVNGTTEEWAVNANKWKVVDKDDSYTIRSFADHREIQIAEEKIESALLRLRFGCTGTSDAVTFFIKLLQNATYLYPPLVPDTTTTTTLLTTPTESSIKPTTLNLTTPMESFTTPKVNFTTPKANFTTPKVNLTTPVANFTTSIANFTKPTENYTTTVLNSTTPTINSTILTTPTHATNTTVVSTQETTSTNRTTVFATTENESTTETSTTTQEATVVSPKPTSTIAVTVIADESSDRKTTNHKFMIILAVVVGCLILLILLVLVSLKRRRRGSNGITSSPSRRACVSHEEHAQPDDSGQQPVPQEKYNEINPDNYATLTGNYKYEENYQALQLNQNEAEYFETEPEYHDPDMVADFSKRMPPNWYAYQDMCSNNSEPFYIQADQYKHYSSINSIDKVSEAKYENDGAFNDLKGSAISYEDAEEIVKNRKRTEENSSLQLENDFNDFAIV